jgi:prophage regulatory protein
MVTPERFLRYVDLEPKKGIPWTRQYVRRLEKEGRFPRKISLGGQTKGWLESQIDAWFEERAATRNGAASEK